MMKNLQGRTFLVTGGASGLGEATVRSILQRGGNAVILDFNKEGGENLCSEIDPESKRTLFIQTDVTKEDDIKKAIEQSIQKFKSIRGVINCAGIGYAQRIATQREAHNADSFKMVIDINLFGTFNVCRLVAQALINQEPDSEGERGVIINTASVAAFEGQTGQVAYAASKGGVVAMTLVMARDLSRHGIRVVTIAPGTFDTPMLRRLPDDTLKKITEPIAFPKRLGHAEEFGHLVVGIIENPYINGETIRLDGGVRLSSL